LGSPALRPLLAPWYRLVPDGDRLLLEHGRAVVVLEGAAVRSFVPALLPLLDGSRTLDDLEERLGHSARPAIEATVELLAEHGLVIEGPDADSESSAGALALGAAYGLAPGTAAERLAGARIGVAGGSPLGAEAARALRSAGVAEVLRLDTEEDAHVDLMLVMPAADEVALLREWNRLALERGTCWIGLRPFDGLLWSIGPLVVPGESCCYECLLLRLASHLDYGSDAPLIEQSPPAAIGGRALELVALGVLLQLALGWIVGRDGSLPGVLQVIETRPGIALSGHSVLRVPRCGACSPAERLAPRLPWHEAEPTREVAA